jgi:photosystem II stability/assembly factor-like uncharacterized protein
MFDKTSGWGVEATGHIVRTTDGGSSWQDVTPPLGQYESGGFFARNANTAWATPYQPICFTFNCPPGPKSTVIWRTADGGRTWQPSRTLCLGGDCGYDYYASPEYLETIALQFVNENTGWMLVTVAHFTYQDHYRVYRTIDGGENWKMVSDSGRERVFEATGLAFQDDRTGWFGSSEVDGDTTPSADWSIHRTRDAGVTWETVKLPPPANLPANFTGHTVWCGAKNVSVIPPQVVDLTISCKVYLEDAGPDKRPHYNFHYHSLDGGQTWRSWQFIGNKYYFLDGNWHNTWQSIGNMSFVDAAQGWRLFSPDPARPNQLQKTTDGGLNWVDVKEVAWQSAQFDFITGQVGWAIVSNGNATALVGTRDGGKTWVDLSPKEINSR